MEGKGERREGKRVQISFQYDNHFSITSFQYDIKGISNDIMHVYL